MSRVTSSSKVIYRRTFELAPGSGSAVAPSTALAWVNVLITHGAELELPLEPPCAVCRVRSCWGRLPAPTLVLCPLPPPWALGSRAGGRQRMGQPARLTAVFFFLFLFFFPSLCRSPREAAVVSMWALWKQSCLSPLSGRWAQVERTQRAPFISQGPAGGCGACPASYKWIMCCYF